MAVIYLFMMQVPRNQSVAEKAISINPRDKEPIFERCCILKRMFREIFGADALIERLASISFCTLHYSPLSFILKSKVTDCWVVSQSHILSAFCLWSTSC